MTHSLRLLRVFLPVLLFLLIGFPSADLFAQLLSTQPLAITSICPGAQLDVTGLRSGAGEGYAIELSGDGTTYTEIPSEFVSASGRYEITYRATIPANTPPGTSYRVRITSKNPDSKGAPSPSLLTVTSPPAKPTLASDKILGCQFQSIAPLAATTTEASASLVWYATNAVGGTGTSTAPQPATDQVGMVRYYVAQKINGCESDRAEITVDIKPTPAAPTVQSVGSCQGGQPPSLRADGQSLLWYTTESGGSGAGTAPAVNTTQTGQTSYYVSQRLDGCESPRAKLTVTVSTRPSAPVANPLTLCQFAAPQTVSATGENLTWYNMDGNKFDSAPTISPTKSESFSLSVSQTINGCESPKATLPVRIVAAPVPTVAQPVNTVCQGTAAQPLSATGISLKWTDPAGNVTTTPPTPATQQATTNPDGDTYYVTQTVNGCESPRVAIRVVVQTLPTLSVTAPATINLGIEVPLKLTFTGAGPYQYKLSNGLTGTATKDTTIQVLAEKTTTYQVSEVSNQCGTGKPGSSPAVTVAVQVPTIQTLPLTSATVCAGSNLPVAFTTTGTFNPGSVFKLQIAKAEGDSTKVPFTDLEGLPVNGQITGVIPGNATAGTYWVRAVATNPKIPIIGSISATRLIVRQLPAATLAGTQRIFEGQPASLSVVFSGDGPWTFAYRDSSATGVGSGQLVTTAANPHVLTVRPLRTTSYVLTSVRNGCGVGTLTARTVVVTVDPLLGVEDPSLTDAVSVYPVPAVSTLTLTIRGFSAVQPAHVTLTDATGRVMNQQEIRQASSDLNLSTYPTGTYILNVQLGDRKASKRILKL